VLADAPSAESEQLLHGVSAVCRAEVKVDPVFPGVGLAVCCMARFRPFSWSLRTTSMPTSGNSSTEPVSTTAHHLASAGASAESTVMVPSVSARSDTHLSVRPGSGTATC
jgi:hypothetical protein